MSSIDNIDHADTPQKFEFALSRVETTSLSPRICARTHRKWTRSCLAIRAKKIEIIGLKKIKHAFNCPTVVLAIIFRRPILVFTMLT